VGVGSRRAGRRGGRRSAGDGGGGTWFEKKKRLARSRSRKKIEGDRRPIDGPGP
jgi:hypothetical protein